MRNPYDAIGRIGLFLAIVGAINWLLVGLFEWNLVKWIFTQSATQTVDNLGERIVYIVVGAGGVLAIPMLAATLARARGRDVRSDETYDRDRAGYDSDRHDRDSDRYDRDRREVAEDDTAFYYGAPKEGRGEEHHEDRPDVAASSESRSSEQRPVRKTERVIIRTEEPILDSSHDDRTSELDSTDRDVRSTDRDLGSTDRDPDSTDRDLRYGTVEEADDDYRESSEERRRAA